ncbi:SOS response-associated peptidase [Methylomarinum sp. Ch1-1]|uniref:Abasic site processing protein n=1 Tax=Methylomarinum roseum TaxID=3067653 RepID=A0AAU7NSQ4_9GAMM|nr:SOS response-associated peptidase [Methylomarinum sp. Ch1-1]MDP4519981.1 SOS response-associated peptidase [Methylomarinum sp. Ch1-1]
MCGRFNLLAEPEGLIENFQLRRLSRYQRRYNIAPGQKILTVVALQDGSLKGVNLIWGLIPRWAKERKIGSRLINARAETVDEKPAFREAYRQRRCLIPASGFYEWQKTDQGKQAYHLCKSDQRLFAFAGLWESWQQGSETLYSCTIVTTAANALMQPVHQRMPVVIAEQNYRSWLAPQASSGELRCLLGSDGYQDFTVSPVSDWVNNPRHDDQYCLT